MVKIFFVYAENCEHCQAAFSCIEDAIIKCKEIPCEIIKFHYDTKASLSIAMNKGINDLPGFVIGDEVFVGKNYSVEEIEKAIRKAANDG